MIKIHEYDDDDYSVQGSFKPRARHRKPFTGESIGTIERDPVTGGLRIIPHPTPESFLEVGGEFHPTNKNND